MKYYVLGKKDNQMLQSYLDKYFELLKNRLLILKENHIFSEECDFLLDQDQREVIMHPDFSSMINLFYQHFINKNSRDIDIQKYEKIFQQEIQYLQNWEYQKSTLNKWEKIAHTQIRLTDEIINPYDWLDAHPDHENTGGFLGYGEKNIEEWREVYAKTFQLLKEVDEWFYSELNQIISKIAPMGTAYWLHNSASYKETIGTLYLWYTIDAQNPEINNLEAIIHESSHNKLNLIMQFDPLVLNDAQEIYYSPYRPDARHIHGTFLWLHAFVPTMYILAQAYLQRKFICNGMWKEKILLYHMKNKICLNVIQKYAKLSPLWQEILKEIQEVFDKTRPLIRDMNFSQSEKDFVAKEFKKHFQSVNTHYPYLKY